MNGFLYYTVDATIPTRVELWKTTWNAASGTAGAAGVLVASLPAGTTASDLVGAGNSVLYFTVQNAASAYQLWRSDGTTAGTLLTATLPGPADLLSAEPQFQVRIIDDGTLVGDTATARFDTGVLTVNVRMASTTTNTIATAINALFGFTATMGGSSTTLPFTGLTQVSVTGGVDAVFASFRIDPAGENNNFIITAVQDGPAWNNRQLLFVQDSTLTAGQARADYDGTTLTVFLNNMNGTVTKAAAIVAAVDRLDNWSASLDYSNTGVGAVTVASIPAGALVSGNGDTLSRATFRLQPSGNFNDLVITARQTGATWNGKSLVFVRTAA